MHDGGSHEYGGRCQREPVLSKARGEPKGLEGCDLLFIHIPSAQYTPGEVAAISKYIAGGGSLFLVMDQDMWSTLEQTKVNDLIVRSAYSSVPRVRTRWRVVTPRQASLPRKA